MLKHTEILSIFSTNPAFLLVKFTFFCHRERFEIPITELIMIEIHQKSMVSFGPKHSSFYSEKRDVPWK